MRDSVRLLSASGNLGYGFPADSLERGVAAGLDLIGCDGGSSDPGPHYLGCGEPFVSEMALARDLRLMLRAAVPNGIPMIVGTAGGAGGAPHLETLADIVCTIAREEGLHFRLALIEAEQDKASIIHAIEQDRVRPLGRRPALDEATVERATRIVGVMGPEPYAAALDRGAQVILAGRSSDPAPFAAVAMYHGMPAAPSWYAGKMLECGSLPAIPKSHDCLIATVREDSIDCEPPNPSKRCVPVSVINHSLHENPSPVRHVEPGGILTTDRCRFDAISDRVVRISGMEWTPAEYTVKLEAAEFVGYRTVTMCGTHDPILIGQIDAYLASVRGLVAAQVADFGIAPSDYTLTFHVYGRDGVMATREPQRNSLPHELGFVVDVVAGDRQRSKAVLGATRTKLLHSDFPGRLCRGGNMAFLFSPSDVEMGPVYRFSMSHVVIPESPTSMFPTRFENI